jgi:adenine-specific DNA-methyltransferase
MRFIKAARERVATSSPDLRAERIEQLKRLFPELVTEGKIDREKLLMLLGEEVDGRPERYSFSWAGKRDAMAALQTPSTATLVPAPSESVDYETTRNLFVEGDNLEVLKLLYKPYFGRVKMIYIDPPYNTGNDFIYPDDFAHPLDRYLEITGQRDADGNLLTTNPETSGRYHSDWLSMMYPRLFLARDLLREDGVIFVSIDDHEVFDLRLIMNEIFGEENFIAELVWEKTRKNDAKLFSVGHEYALVYAKSLETLKRQKTIWREAKPGAKEIMEQYRQLRARHGSDDKAIETALQLWYRSLRDSHPSKKLSRYKHVDRYGPWRDRDISWPGGGGPTYDVIHPKTKQKCRVPERGWGIATPEAMQEQTRLGLVVFRDDHTEPPIRKAHLVPIPEELDDDSLPEQGSDDTDSDQADDQVGMQVMPSVTNKQSQVAVKYLRNLMGGKVFDNPKDHTQLARWIKYCTTGKDGDLIVDFFAGSCSTAEAVLDANHEDGGSRRYIMVQLPEKTPVNSPARKAGYDTIADLGKERIRRALAKLRRQSEGTLPLTTRETP